MNYLYKIYQKMKFDKHTNAYEVESWCIHRFNTETFEIFKLECIVGSMGSVDIWLPVYPSMLTNLSQMTDFITLEEAINYLEKYGLKTLSSKLMNHL